MTNLLDAARQALDTLTHIIGMRHLSYIGQAMAESAERTLRTAIAEAEKTHCRYPECVENEREECQRWISGECPGPGNSGGKDE